MLSCAPLHLASSKWGSIEFRGFGGLSLLFADSKQKAAALGNKKVTRDCGRGPVLFVFKAIIPAISKLPIIK